MLKNYVRVRAPHNRGGLQGRASMKGKRARAIKPLHVKTRKPTVKALKARAKAKSMTAQAPLPPQGGQGFYARSAPVPVPPEEQTGADYSFTAQSVDKPADTDTSTEPNAEAEGLAPASARQALAVLGRRGRSTTQNMYMSCEINFSGRALPGVLKSKCKCKI